MEVDVIHLRSHVASLPLVPFFFRTAVRTRGKAKGRTTVVG